MKKLFVSCAALLLTAVCMATSLSCSSGNEPRGGEGLTIDKVDFTTTPVIPNAKEVCYQQTCFNLEQHRLRRQSMENRLWCIRHKFVAQHIMDNNRHLVA